MFFSCSGPDKDYASDFVASPEIKTLSATIKKADLFATIREKEINSLKSEIKGRNNL